MAQNKSKIKNLYIILVGRSYEIWKHLYNPVEEIMTHLTEEGVSVDNVIKLLLIRDGDKPLQITDQGGNECTDRVRHLQADDYAIIFSDGVSESWTDGTFGDFLKDWNRVSIATPWPPRHMPRIGLFWKNHHEKIQPENPWPNNDRLVPDSKPDLKSIPYFSLPPGSEKQGRLVSWVKAMSGQGTLECILLGPNPTDIVFPEDEKHDAELPEGEKLLRRYWKFASPNAKRLASRLCFSPVDIEVVVEANSKLFPDAKLLTVAEFYYGGIVAKSNGTYDYKEGVRKILSFAQSVTEAREIMNVVGRHVGLVDENEPLFPNEADLDRIAEKFSGTPLQLAYIRCLRDYYLPWLGLSDHDQERLINHSGICAIIGEPGAQEG